MTSMTQSDRHCTDITLKTAAGTEMTLAEFYEMKRMYTCTKTLSTAHALPPVTLTMCISAYNAC